MSINCCKTYHAQCNNHVLCFPHAGKFTDIRKIIVTEVFDVYNTKKSTEVTVEELSTTSAIRMMDILIVTVMISIRFVYSSNH